MLVRYHWGCGVGHTYAHTEAGVDATGVPVIEETQVEGHENDVPSSEQVGLLREYRDRSESEHLLGEDNMVYEKDSSNDESREDEVCCQYFTT